MALVLIGASNRDPLRRESLNMIGIELREQSLLVTTSLGRSTGGMTTPQMWCTSYTKPPTTSIPLDSLGARGWQVFLPLV